RAARWAADPARDDEPGRITVLPQRVRELRDLLLDVAALRALLDDRAELENDRPARREVAGRLIEAQQSLAHVIVETYGGAHSRWFHRHENQTVASARQIDELLSDAADATYPQTPQVWNELIVRRQLSAAATKARRNLVEAMLDRAGEERLGLAGFPPERAIYESVMRAGGLHRQGDAGGWAFGPPTAADPLRLRPAWDALDRLIAAEAPEPHPLTELFAALEAPPFGVKAGLTPLLFMALYKAREGEIVLYERENYVPIPDMALFERLLTRPQHFAVRLSRADGARREVYRRFAEELAPRALAQPVQPALLTATLPLFRLMRDLPEFSKQTRRISAQAQAFRSALREARAPDQLLFERLPAACALPPFQPAAPADPAQLERFISALRAAMQELQAAYPGLLRDLAERIRAAFRCAAADHAALRAEIHARYSLIADTTGDIQIRGLGVRLETADEAGDAWVESVAALVTKRPPELWADKDIAAFELGIMKLGNQFGAAEDIAVAAQAVPHAAPLLHVGITNGQGEVRRVLHLAPDDPAVQRLSADLSAALGRHLALTADQRAAALAEILQSMLKAE
ncbi:MAG: hypothetical protein WCI67_02650, partial [Chloroflexales bacterium]